MATQPQSATTAVIPSRTTARFYVCVAILLLTAGGKELAAGYLESYFRKLALPLKRPLDALDQSKLLPQYRPHRIQPGLLSHEMIENLGTEEYLQWNLRDLTRDRDDPTSVVQLFITYYTGGSGLVPHRPQECHAASGATMIGEKLITVPVTDSAGVVRKINVSLLEFELPRQQALLLQSENRAAASQMVAYFFYVNGKYETTRTDVRRAVSKLTDRYAYYSKIEVSFINDTFNRLPNREEAEAATRRLLKKLMPILWDDHYQDWEAIQNGSPPVSADQHT